jgi:hypothetical protein
MFIYFNKTKLKKKSRSVVRLAFKKKNQKNQKIKKSKNQKIN